MQQLKWLLTNNKELYPPLGHKYETEGFNLFVSKIISENKGIKILIDGYILPRNEYLDQYVHLSQIELVELLFLKHGSGLVNYIKGIFNLIIIYEEKLFLCNDQQGLKKYFSLPQQNTLTISNDYSIIISCLKNPEINEEAICQHALFQHFIDGNTIIKDIRYSKAASALTYDGRFIESCYWSWKDLFSLKRSPVPFQSFARQFHHIVKAYIDYLHPESVHLTLTGGRDSRTILAALLHSGISPKSFTFGSPGSADVLTAKEIAQKCVLPFSNHFNAHPNHEWYSALSQEIIEKGESLVHIHRSHRMDSAKKEASENSIVFLGSNGGDYIKGAHMDGYIITNFVKEYFFNKNQSDDLIEETLNLNFIRSTPHLLNQINDQLKELTYYSLESKELEFAIVHELVGQIHCYQDINLFSGSFNYVVAPFMDIDFLYLLFSSTYSLFDNHQTSDNPLKKMKGGDLQCSIIKYLYPSLAEIDFANRYSPNDLLGNQYAYLAKRLIKGIFATKRPANFPYDSWFVDFVKEHAVNIHPALENIIDQKKMINRLSNDQHKSTEGYWHKYTNIIMFSMLLNKYLS